ncbi:MAG: porin [Pseudomonadota bacterium]
MKKSIRVLALIAALPGLALADEATNTVTIYGVIDANVAASTNTGAATTAGTGLVSVGPGPGSTRTVLGQGLFQGSRWGIKGARDFGDGNKAIFNLEGGVYLGTGVIDQQGQIFGRQAWVGLENARWGQLTLGRTYGTFSDAIGSGDVFGENHGNEVLYKPVGPGNTAGNYGGSNGQENTFFYNYSGLRWDNSVKYRGKFNNVTLGAQHASGKDTGADMYAASIGYDNTETLKATVSIQDEQDSTGKTHKDIVIAGQFKATPVIQLYSFYMQSKFDAGFANVTKFANVPGSANGGTGTTATSTNSELSGPAFAREDDVFNLSIKYTLNPSWDLIGTYYNDRASNVAAAGDSGTRNTYMAIADYFLDKKTDLYVAVAHSTLSGAVAGANSAAAGMFATAGISNTSLYTAGIRYRF